jgi:predicted AlkP superfamily phosphohydrolase/phosphomutase
MKRSSRLPLAPLLVALLLAGARLEAQTPLNRVVVVSFDGVGGRALWREAEHGTFGPDGFLKAEATGLCADRMEVVTPSLTSVSHAALSAGALPSSTGIVANTFHPAAAALKDRVSGFDTESGVETIWEAAARQGKRVASLAWPGASQASGRTRTPVALKWADPQVRSFTWKGPSAEAAFEDALVALPPEQPSFSPPKILPVRSQAASPGGALDRLRFVAVDTSDDGRRNYDLLLVLGADGSVAARVRPGDWFPLSERRAEDQGDRDVLVGRWCKLLALPADLSAVRVYVGSEGRSFASPDDFRRTLDREAGFWPGPPDDLLLEGEPDTRSFVEQEARFASFFQKAFAVANRRGDWDLLLAYVPCVDEAEHALLLSDPRQPSYTPERAALAAAALHEVWRLADETAAAYLSFASRGDVFLVSDHGMRPVWSSFLLQELLRRRGFLEAAPGPRGRLVTAPGSKVDAVAAGAVGYVFVNRAGVLPGGTVPPAEAELLLRDLATALRAEKDEAGKPLFSAVLTRNEARSLGLDHPNAGDLVLVAAGEVTFRHGFTDRPDAPLLVPAQPPGQHGFGPDPELDGIFFEVGAGVGRKRVPLVRSIDVAAMVAARLGIAPPGKGR